MNLGNNSFVQDLPFAILSKCRDGSAIEILKLNEDLHIASARMKPLDPTKHHHGYSFGYTVSRGGGYAGDNFGGGGGIHANQNVKKHPELQHRLVVLCRAMINKSIGQQIMLLSTSRIQVTASRASPSPTYFGQWRVVPWRVMWIMWITMHMGSLWCSRLKAGPSRSITMKINS